MANNQKNHSGNVNQPRRKRNRKPVKRYSEEYTNRPNPYTGYSADGNYHPGVKKEFVHEYGNSELHGEYIGDRHATAHNSEYTAADAPSVNPTPQEPLVESISSDEPRAVRAQVADAPAASVRSADGTAGNGERRKAVAKPVSYRKKNADDKARRQRDEELRTAINKSAMGVAAHEVSEQMIDDIQSVADLIKSKPIQRANADAASKAEDEAFGSDEAFGGYESAYVPTVVEVGEDEPLPFDRIIAARAEAKPDAVIQPLKPEDLIPVLDFDKPAEPAIKFNTFDEDEGEAPSAETEESETAAVREPFGSDMIFEVSRSGGWDNAIVPPVVPVEPQIDEEDESQPPPEAVEAMSASIDRLLEICFDAGGSPQDETHAEEEQNEPEEESEPEVELNDIVESRMKETADREAAASALMLSDADFILSFISAEGLDEDAAETYIGLEDDFDLEVEEEDREAELYVSESEELSEILSDEDKDETEDVSFETFNAPMFEDELPENVSAEPEEAPEVESSDERLKALVEAAEVAEIFREESRELEGGAVASADEQDDADAYDLGELEPEEPQSDESAEASVGEQETEQTEAQPTESQPTEAQSDENEEPEVFESILVVDDETFTPPEDGDPSDTMFLHVNYNAQEERSVARSGEPIVLPTDVDDGDFQEHWFYEKEESGEVESREKSARRRISALVGAVVVIVAFVGAVWAIRITVNGIFSIGSTSELKVEYMEFIEPVVLNDPDPFESVDAADNSMLLQSAIWSVLDSIDDAEDYEYEYDATGKIILSGSTVEAAARSLFGSSVELELNVLSESDGDVLYYYDSVGESFHIAAGGIDGPTGSIIKIARKTDYVSLIVAYYDTDEISDSSSGEDVEAYKYMEYILAFNDDDTYYIQSIRNYDEG